MTVLVFGGNGQVGQELLRALTPLGTVVATTRSGQLPDGSACEVADFGQPDSLPALLDRLQPSVVVNAAAYTAVDRAEQEVDAAFAANAQAPGVIARWCAAQGVPFVHYSTDYVFDGQGTAPYREDEPTAPLGVYGTSKRDGEEAVRAAGGRHLIFRTAWVYASHGANFLRTMLRVGAERDALRVVADQIGTPTPAALIADVTAMALQRSPSLSGTWHLTANGQTSWYGFAEAIFAEALALGVLERVPAVEEITSADYPTPARRPAWSVLDNRGLQDALGIRL
ncbi:dTDP-4-dehydrorhamnose reductase, partial [Stenotrophomonas maltophilia]